ncbi:MAG TPA: glycosyltransferase [bacterium]|nr:glycosyltransferase [bacterium]
MSMRILTVTNIYPTPQFPARGSFVKAQVDSLIREGIESDLVYINNIDTRFAFVKKSVEILGRSCLSRYDLIHAHYGTSGVAARMQIRLPVVVSFLGSDLLGNPDDQGGKTPYSRLVVLAGRFLSNMVDAVIVKSAELRSLIPRKDNVHIIPNGVDFDRFQPEDRILARKKTGLSPGRKYILFPSNAEWTRKGFALAREAVACVRARGIDVELIPVYGKPQETVPDYMNAADAMVMTSMWEGSPNVIKESMAVNLPIVSMDVGDVREIITGTEGCFISPRDPLVIADRLEWILKWGGRTDGRKRIRHLDSRRVARRIIRIYQQIVRGKPHGIDAANRNRFV